ncbi:hypothetical protein, partial [Serratia marcescens]|uniref:hypothetical protein n=1 Tax=Serratia marcescens TaxID=615 RepID=UPI001954715F
LWMSSIALAMGSGSDPHRPMTQHIIKNAVHNIQHEATFVTEETNLNALITIEIKLNNLTLE